MKRRLPEPLRGLLDHLHTSLWFLPMAIVAGGLALAVLMLQLDERLDLSAGGWLFDADPEAARVVLSTIAGSIMTVAGVVFSITIVVLTLAASQYSPRVIRNFMRDRLSQVVLGVFSGVFAYCLLVLGAVNGSGEVPVLATSIGMASALFAIGLLVFYIHHIARAIQAVHILAAAAGETFHAVDTLFPDGLGDEPPPGACLPPPVRCTSRGGGLDGGSADAGAAIAVVPCHRTGYLQRVDVERLLRLAEDADAVLHLQCNIGDFIAEGDPLLAVQGSASPPRRRLVRAIRIGRFQTVDQDPGYGLREIVDVALRALSPAMNDESSAAEAIDYVGAVLARLAARPQPSRHRFRNGKCRVVVRAESFGWMLELGFAQIVRAGANSPETLRRVLQALERVARNSRSDAQLAAISAMAGRVARAADTGVTDPEDRQRTVSLARALQQSVATNLT